MSELCIAVRSRVASVSVRSNKVDVTGRPDRIQLYATQQGPTGPPGPPGAPGSAFDGAAWWYGEGVPGSIVGSKPGDYYLNTLTGVVYRLGS